MSTTRQLCKRSLLFIAMASTAAASLVEAGTRWGAVVIRNPSSVSIPFQMRLGTSGPWTDYRAPAESEYAIYFDLDRYGRVPPPHIRFDCVTDDGNRVTLKNYRLDFYEVDAWDWYRGKPYTFEYNSAGTRLDLYKAD